MISHTIILYTAKKEETLPIMQIPLIVRHILILETLKCGGDVHLTVAEVW